MLRLYIYFIIAMNYKRLLFALCVFGFGLSLLGQTETASVDRVRGGDQTSSTKLISNSINNDWRILKHDGCIAEFRAVNLPTSANETFHPSCVRVRQCGGGCDELNSCQPVPGTTVEHILSVYVTPKFQRNPKSEKRNITVIEHVRCQCQRKIKSCPTHQVYNENTYRCDCPNSQTEISECNANSYQRWNSNSCKCDT